jgi:hypothetical protein
MCHQGGGHTELAYVFEYHTVVSGALEVRIHNEDVLVVLKLNLKLKLKFVTLSTDKSDVISGRTQY